MMAVNEIIQKLIREQGERKFYSSIPIGNVMDEGFHPQVFEPHNSYFQIRLAEM